MMILAMDLGKFNTVCCFYDTQSRKYRFETIGTKRAHLDHFLDSHQADLVVMEACGPSGWISDVCKGRGIKTIVCSTHDDAWSWKNTKRKTDRDDALKLAKMAVLDALTPAPGPTADALPEPVNNHRARDNECGGPGLSNNLSDNPFQQHPNHPGADSTAN